MVELTEARIQEIMDLTGADRETILEVAKTVPDGLIGRIVIKSWACFRCLTCLGLIRKIFWCIVCAG